MSRHTNRGGSVGNTRTESTNVASFMETRQPHVVVVAVDCNVLVMLLRQLLDRSLDHLHPPGLTHGLGAIVGVAPSSVPISLKGFGMEGHLDSPLLGDPNQKISGHPQVVAHGDPFTGTNLELPLRGHHFGVDSADVDAGI